MRILKWIAYKLPVLRGVLAQRNELRVANAGLATRAQELETALDDAAKVLEAAEAARLEVATNYEQANAERWAAIQQREQMEVALSEAVRQREGADAERAAAIKQRDEAEAARDVAVGQRDAAEAARSEVVRRCEEVSWEDRPDLAKQGLFIVGHARSGTTVLLRALNMSPDIYVLGEANLHVEGLKTGFARWYNEMHRADGQPNTKFTFCPVAPRQDANGVETLEWLAERFRYIGDKVAFRSEKLGYDPRRFFDFHARHFFTSHYVCVVRNPVDTLKSCVEMFKPDDLSIYAESYLRSFELILDLYYTFPNVLVLFHERVNQETFDRIGERLGIDLGGIYAAYHKRFQVIERHGSDDSGLPGIEILREAHRQMREAFSPQTLREIPVHPQWLNLAESIRAMREQIVAEASGLQAVPRHNGPLKSMPDGPTEAPPEHRAAVSPGMDKPPLLG